MKLDRFLPGLTAGLVLGGAATAFAATRTYQYTGVLKDATKTQISVDKGGEVWDFVVDPGTTGSVGAKPGSKVTVTYRMHATRIDTK